MNGHLDLASSLTPLLTGYVLVLARVGAFIFIGPVWSVRFIPHRVKVILALVVAFVAYVSAGQPVPAKWDLMVVARETGLGLLMGVASRAVLEAALSLGTIFSGQIGFSFAQTVDPTAGTHSDALSDLVAFLALSLAVALGLHREAIVLLCSSVRDLPPGSVSDLTAFIEVAIGQIVGACALAARLSFPLMATTSAGYLVMGLIARGAPGLGLQGLGFTIPVVAGGFAMFALAPATAEVVARSAVSALHAFD